MSSTLAIHISNRTAGGMWWRIPTALILWSLFAVPVVVGVAAVVKLRGYAADLPDIPDFSSWRAHLPQTNTFYALDGTILARRPFSVPADYHANSQHTDSADTNDNPETAAEALPRITGYREWVSYDEIPRQLVQAIVAAEDGNFFTHPGVDARAIVRATLRNYQAGRVVEGASTITQQVVRNLLPKSVGKRKNIARKIREALLAWKLERRYSKREIFEVYANLIFLGANSYGLKAAARRYFGKELYQLALHENALLAGLPQSPARYAPNQRAALARRRRDKVLERMHNEGFIEHTQLRAALDRSVRVRPPPKRYGTLAPWQTEYVRRSLKHDYPNDYAIGGLNIYTTADPVSAHKLGQQTRSYTRSLKLDTPPQAAALAWDLTTGYVEAHIGGRQWSTSQFDRATQACRQPGSAFKPILYATALANHAITPATLLRDMPIAEYSHRNNEYWKPKHGDRQFRGAVVAHDALVHSLNGPSVDILKRVGTDAIIKAARRLGITTTIAPGAPLALGSSCVKLYELGKVFTAFAKPGTVVEPIYVTRAERGRHRLFDRTSKYDPTAAYAHRVDRWVDGLTQNQHRPIRPGVGYLVARMLRDVVQRGTGTAARRIKRPAAGKTGTTNKNSDVWFSGFTQHIVTVAWLGYDDPSKSLGSRHEGGTTAVPLWNRVVSEVSRDRPFHRFLSPAPKDIVELAIDRETGLRASPHTTNAIRLGFESGTEPEKSADTPASLPQEFERVSEEF